MRKLLTLLLTVVITVKGRAQETFPVNGINDERHSYYAFINAKIYTDYQTVLDSSTLLIRNGKVEAVGKSISIPAEATVYDLKGKLIYPSLIDMFSDYGMPDKPSGSRPNRGPQFITDKDGAYNWNEAIKPETEAFNLFKADSKKAEELRKLGFGITMSFMRDGIARGTSAVVALADLRENELIIKDRAAAGYSFDKGSSSQDYPGSLMGAIALLRQTYLDAQWYKQTKAQREYNISLETWNNLQSLPQIFEVRDKLSALRADKIGDEFGVKYIIKGGGDEYQRIEEIKNTGDQFILSINFPDALDMSDPYDADNISLGEMKHWEMAPGNAAVFEKNGMEFSITAADLKNKTDFWKNLRKAILYGLSEKQALKSVTMEPAVMMGIADKAGALKKGMLANFIITSKSIFDKENVIYENWVLGRRYIISDYGKKDIRGNYEFKVGNLKSLNLKISGDAMNPEAVLEEDSLKNKITFNENNGIYTLSFELKNTGVKGTNRMSGYLESDVLKGTGNLADGTPVEWMARKTSEAINISKKDTAREEKPVIGPLTFPNKSYGFKELPQQENYLLKNATVWTNEQQGILKNTDVLIQKGKISRISRNIDAKASGVSDKNVYDATGKHISAGIIDEHSHIAISGDVNECTQSVTSEVRIGDVVDCDDIYIYRQLAGGVTMAHLLHGSCNPIGGQTALIKLRWGSSPEQMKMEGADGFIKFALGENVKQSNWGDFQTTRYPQTRMGVEQVYMNAFTRAQEYQSAWKKYNAATDKIALPRKDLELDALAEILSSKRFITCHSYEQSEINMLMHVADSFHFRVNTFTHILEGYKVADKMKKHGAGGSSFADWWAYKYEVMEAIPYNGAIMHKEGITVAFNSDDGEMARRLNQEAAKAVKYGGVSEEEALKFVTLNPAKLLHVDNRVGSIKEGKDADIVVWSDNPLSIYARALQTYVDGKLYFDLDRDRTMQEDNQKERARIIQKMMKEKGKGEKTQKPGMTLLKDKHCLD